VSRGWIRILTSRCPEVGLELSFLGHPTSGHVRTDIPLFGCSVTHCEERAVRERARRIFLGVLIVMGGLPRGRVRTDGRKEDSRKRKRRAATVESPVL